MLLNTESADAKIAIIIITKGTVIHSPFIILFVFLSLVFSCFILNFPASEFLNSVIVSPIYANGSITISKILSSKVLGIIFVVVKFNIIIINSIGITNKFNKLKKLLLNIKYVLAKIIIGIIKNLEFLFFILLVFSNNVTM